MSTSPTEPDRRGNGRDDADPPLLDDTSPLEMRVVHHDNVLRSDPERYLVALRSVTPEGDRYVLLRWPDWPPPTLLSVQRADRSDTLEEALAVALRARLDLAMAGSPALASSRLPVRMRHPSTGREGVGWLQPVGVDVVGEPRPDALLAEAVTMTLDDALAALASDVERAALRAAASALATAATS